MTFLILFFTYFSPAQDVDLHNHLFIEEGTISLYQGDAFEPIQAKAWDTKWASKMNAQSLNESKFRLVVISFYAHPLASGTLRDSIRRQIEKTHRFLNEYPQWSQARSPDEAQALLKKGRRVLVLSLEGASGILENEEDLKEFIDQNGISIVTLLHFLDDEFGGASLLKGFQGFILNPVAFLRSIFTQKSQGLTDLGKSMAAKLMDRGVWIDLAHASDQSQADLLQMMKERHIPPLHTHTVHRSEYKAERAINDEQLIQIAETKGAVGIIASEDMLGGEGVAALNKHIQLFTKILGSGHVFWGTDFNAPLKGIRGDWKPEDFHELGKAEDFVKIWQEACKPLTYL